MDKSSISAADQEHKREQQRAACAKYYREHREEIREQRRKYREQNSERLLEQARAYRERRRQLEQARYLTKRDEIREQHRAYYEANKKKVLAKNARNRRLNPVSTQQSVKRWMARNPAKVAAHFAVSRAIKSGLLIRPDRCQDCGKPTKPHAHHHLGYSLKHRLDVLWLCHQCHVNRHHV